MNDEGWFSRVLDRTGLRSGPGIDLRYRLAPVPVAKLADRLDRRFGSPWRDARVVVGRESARVVDAKAGEGVDRHALRQKLRTLPSRVELAIVPIRPVVSRAEAEAALARLERLLDGPRRVRFRDAEATLTPKRVRGLVRTEREDGSLGVALDPKGLGDSLRIRLGRYESAPRDATFAVGAAGVSVVPSRPGRALDVARIGRSLVTNLDSTAHLARFTATSPSFTTEQAEKLDIRELVSEFTTYYPCCQPRVTNIQRAAQLIDGTIVLPGKAFSLNEALGERTVEKGFVSAPQIFDGRLEDAVGGGITQVATTLYNAAFFAGVKIVAHQPHQFYISRYPMGREATVSGGARADLPERLAHGDPDEGRGERLGDHRPLLLAQARPARRDRDREALCVHVSPDDPEPELVPASRVDDHGPVVRRLGVHGPVHAEGVQGRELLVEREIHRSLRPAERDRRGRPGEAAAEVKPSRAGAVRSLGAPGAARSSAHDVEARLARPRRRRAAARSARPTASCSTWSVVCVMPNRAASTRSISRRRPWQSSPRPTRTCAESASKPEVIVHTWRSWTLVTPGTAMIASRRPPRRSRTASPP